MDITRLDALARQIGNSTARRTVLGAAVAAVAATLGVDATDAKKKHKHKKHKHHHHHHQHATCTDGQRNGNETDVDCGGACPRCADGQTCVVANDCLSGACAAGQCVACTPEQLCGSNDNGSCRCDEDFQTGDPVCNNAAALGNTVDDCAKCPAETESCVTINGLLFNCYLHCASA